MKPSTPAGVRQLRATALGRFDRRHVTCGPGDRLQMSPPGNLILFRHTPHARPQGCIFASIVFVLPLRPGGAANMRQFGDSDICRARYRDYFPRTDLSTVSFGGGQSLLFCRLPFTAQPLSAVPLRLGFQVQCLSRRTAHNYLLFRDLARDARIILVLSSSASTLGPDSCSAVFALHRLHIFIPSHLSAASPVSHPFGLLFRIPAFDRYSLSLT